MSTITFDTLKLAEKLEASGFTAAQAKGAAAAFADITVESGANVSTKSDIALLRSEMRELEARMTIKMGAMIFTLGGILIAVKFFS